MHDIQRLRVFQRIHPINKIALLVKSLDFSVVYLTLQCINRWFSTSTIWYISGQDSFCYPRDICKLAKTLGSWTKFQSLCTCPGHELQSLICFLKLRVGWCRTRLEQSLRKIVGRGLNVLGRAWGSHLEHRSFVTNFCKPKIKFYSK